MGHTYDAAIAVNIFYKKRLTSNIFAALPAAENMPIVKTVVPFFKKANPPTPSSAQRSVRQAGTML